MYKTQQSIIKEKLLRDKEITNVWAVTHRMLRLSERIRELTEKGWKFEKFYLVKNGRKSKTYVYSLVGRGKD